MNNNFKEMDFNNFLLSCKKNVLKMAQNGLSHKAKIFIFSHFFDIVGPKVPKFVGKPLFPTHFNVI